MSTCLQLKNSVTVIHTCTPHTLLPKALAKHSFLVQALSVWYFQSCSSQYFGSVCF